MAVVYISRGRRSDLRLQGVRDNPRRMEAIGYNVTAHRIAAYAFAALIAAVGGILMVWLNNQISPGLGRHRGRRSTFSSSPWSAGSDIRSARLSARSST